MIFPHLKLDIAALKELLDKYPKGIDLAFIGPIKMTTKDAHEVRVVFYPSEFTKESTNDMQYYLFTEEK